MPAKLGTIPYGPLILSKPPQVGDYIWVREDGFERWSRHVLARVDDINEFYIFLAKV